MAFGDISGRAVTNPKAPQAFGVCDSCGTFYNRKSLRQQFEWSGDTLRNTGFLDCYRCLSKPQQQLRSIILPLDPVPVDQPRPEQLIFIQNLNGFSQKVGPQGSATTNPVPTELDPTNPFRTKAELLASLATGWGLPAPPLVDRSTTVALSGVGQQVLSANPDRTYLLIYNPTNAFLAVAQNGTPALTIPTSTFAGLNLYAPTIPAETGTVTPGTGEAILQNGGATLPATVWTGSVWALGLVSGAPIWIYENA